MAYQFDKVRILIAEDNRPLTEIIKSLLQTFGVTDIHTAIEGGEAYDLFRKFNHDIVIADWMMTPVDGIALCRHIRGQDDSPNPFVPIILMTGYSERKRVFKARDAGITEFLVKPFTAQDLYKRIAQVIERPRQFVKSEHFFGPDRRRKGDATGGAGRRQGDARRDDLPKAVKEPVSAGRTLPVVGADDEIGWM